MLHIFLAHAKEDKEAVVHLYRQLRKRGYHPWLDTEDLLPGQNWRSEISKAIETSQVFIACLSERSVDKEGYVQKELKMALDTYADKPPNSIYLIPVRLDECTVPDLRQEEYGVNLRDLHRVDLFKPNGFERLIKSLESVSESLEHEFPEAHQHRPYFLIDRISRRRAIQILLGFTGGGIGSILLTEPVDDATVEPVDDATVEPVDNATVEPVDNVAFLTAKDFAPFNFEVVTVNEKGESTNPEPKASHVFSEKIGDVDLDLVPIAGGTFTMGSPESEAGRQDDEGPQREVSIQPFLISKYPVTQAHWKAVVSLPKVERDLESDHFYWKGDTRPVETVSWDDVVEFCQRLSKHTDREYRLPSEAEWEYACRAGTTTPFHFGETLTVDLANYNANSTYGAGPRGEYRAQTTEVGIFSANAFGLYDMHGNVWEWCLDHWHSNYEGAPIDGRAWIEGGNSSQRVTRGGGWGSNPGYCRSAFRNGHAREEVSGYIGFRVVCGSSWTL